jgi:hypothetical protein
VPALSSSLIGPALEQFSDLPASDRAVLAGQCPGLLEYLAGVPDPRDRRGVRHSLASLLMTAMAAVLAGATSFTAVSEWVADAPPQVLAALRVRRDPLTRQFQPPGEATIRRVLEAVDAAALDAAVGSWLAARLQAGNQGQGRHRRRAGAVDGKSVRGTRHASSEGQAVHLLAAVDQQAGTVLAQAVVNGKTNEITQFAAAGPGRVRRHRRQELLLLRTRRAGREPQQPHQPFPRHARPPGEPGPSRPSRRRRYQPATLARRPQARPRRHRARRGRQHRHDHRRPIPAPRPQIRS